MYGKRLRLALCVVTLCALLIGCSGSDDGRVADLEEQLDMATAARMTAEQERDTAKAAQTAAEAGQMTAEEARAAAQAARTMADQERDSAKTAQETAEQAEAAAEAARMGAEQALADAQFDSAVANAVERVTAWGLRNEINPDDGRPHGISGTRFDARAYPDSGSEFAAVSQTHEQGDRIDMAVPWHDENGELQFTVFSSPVRDSLSRDGVYISTWSEIHGDLADRDGVTTSHQPVQSHGLGDDWQGFDLVRTYDGHGTKSVRLFADFGKSDVLAQPYDLIISGRDQHRILLSDARVPANPAGPPGRDGLYIVVPEDGLQGSLDGVAGTFSCAGDYCSLLNSADYSAFTPWTDSQAVRFTPADGGADVLLDPARIARPSTDIPKLNYLAFGSWQDVPQDVTDVAGYDFGVFAGGDDPFLASGLPALAGTATYAGKAAGTYAETIRPQVASFAADVDLMADFGSTGESGRVTGMVSNFQLESGSSMPVSSLRLETTWDWQSELWAPHNIRTSWDDSDSFIPGGFIEGETVADGGWWGLWSGNFFGNGPAGPAGHPASFAGTFGATDGTRSIAGSYGVHKQSTLTAGQHVTPSLSLIWEE